MTVDGSYYQADAELDRQTPVTSLATRNEEVDYAQGSDDDTTDHLRMEVQTDAQRRTDNF
jgi:hypothetical protein